MQPAPAPVYAPPPQQPLAPPPPPAEKPNNTLSTVSWIMTGAFAGAGAITGLVAIAQASSVKGQCNGSVCPTSVKGQADSSSTMGNVSTVTFSLAGGWLLLALLTHHSAPKAHASASSVDVVVGPGSIGAMGRF
jgi:hypothetical protein